MKTKLTIVLFSLFCLFNINALPQNIIATKQAKIDSSSKKNDGLEDYIKGRRIDKDGREIIEIIVPGTPPKNYRAPVAKIPNSAKTIANVPAYDWSFGCTATSAAMISGYYDNMGFPNIYTGPTNNGVAPMDNSSWGRVTINGEVRSKCPLSATMNGMDGRTTRGHVDDYWIKTDSKADDPYITNGWTQHTYGDCTGDFMKTNQSAYGNADGGTTLYYYSNGTPYSGENDHDGAYGFQLFLESRGYSVNTRYTQLIYGYNSNTSGFTFAQYKQEIDAGYPVFIQVKGHTMVGIGYDDATSKIYLHDTWDYSTHEMVWGGNYSGLQQWGVTVIHLDPVASSLFVIAASPSPLNSGSISGAGTYNWNQTAKLTASANNGYTFVNWTENGSIVSTDSIYQFTVTATRALSANFNIKAGINLISPQNNSTNASLPVKFQWNKYSDAAKYIFEVSTDSLFSVATLSDSTVTDTIKTAVSLKYNTKYFWRVTVLANATAAAKSSVWNFTTQKFADTVAGVITYANAQNTPVNGIKVYLISNNTIIDSATTDTVGRYSFNAVQDGSFNLRLVVNKTWGGVNSTDALQIRRYIVGLTAFDTLQAKAADVNGSGAVTSSDALLVRMRSSGGASSFAAGDWVYENPTFTVSGKSVNQNIRILCTGDVNGSFTPASVKANNNKEK
jgi:hypothetical protein